MTNSEAQFVESIVNHKFHVNNAQEYIKENFATNSEYDPKENKLYIWTNTIQENLSIIAAKEYIYNEIGSDKIEVIYGKKED